MKENRLIIFDFFGVLGGELSPKWFSHHFTDEKAKELDKKEQELKAKINSVLPFANAVMENDRES